MLLFTTHLSYFQIVRVCFLSKRSILFERCLCKYPESHVNYLPSSKLLPRDHSTLKYHAQRVTVPLVSPLPGSAGAPSMGAQGLYRNQCSALP